METVKCDHIEVLGRGRSTTVFKSVIEHSTSISNIFNVCAFRKLRRNDLRHPDDAFLVNSSRALQQLTSSCPYLLNQCMCVLEGNNNKDVAILSELTQGDLFDVVDHTKGGWLTERATRVVIAQTATALEALHAAGKSLVPPDPKVLHVARSGHIVLDVYHCFVEVLPSASNFGGGWAIEHVAPEILKGKSSFSPSCDWWFLGIVMYELLMGIPPFFDDGRMRTFELVLTQPLSFDANNARTDSPPPAPSADAQDVIARLLDRNVATRLQSLDDLLAHPLFGGVVLDDDKPPFLPRNDDQLTDARKVQFQ
eukprot:PhM_4_TR3493/c0_g1_i1/m.66099/K04688/RPS6KB; ribosomal protein S6 kinase beta